MNKSDLDKYINDFQLKKSIPDIRPGYTITIFERILDVKKSRIQKFQGMVISNLHPNRNTHNVLLRKKLDDVWIEKRFFLHSPLIEDVKVDLEANARRSKLYYLRNYKKLTEKLRRLRK